MHQTHLIRPLCVGLLILAGCDGTSNAPIVWPDEAASFYRGKVKCVAVLNYLPNVEGAKEPLRISPFLSRFSQDQFIVISRTDIKDNRPDFYKTFVSYKTCEDTKRGILKSRKFGKCVISFEETSLSYYQSFFESEDKVRYKKAAPEDPLKCKA